MTSPAGIGDVGAGRELANSDEDEAIPTVETIDEAQDADQEELDRSSDLDEQDSDGQRHSITSHGQKSLAEELSEAATLPPLPSIEGIDNRSDSPSIPDDTPSVKGSIRSSPGSSSVPASRASLRASHSPSPQPFDRRFQARASPSSPLRNYPAFLTPRSRQTSLSSNITQISQKEEEEKIGGEEEPQKPWEVVQWQQLQKISAKAFSEAGKRTFGTPTFLTVAASIAVGTSKGIILLFDYQQTLKSIIGQGTVAAECGSITSLAISADHSTIAGGHASGSIFTWDISRPAKPFLHIPPMPRSQPGGGNEPDGHVPGSAILHLGFLGTRHTALVSADDSGMAFSHLTNRGLGVVGRSVKTTRILGRYPEASKVAAASRKPSSVLGFSALPLGNVEQPTDELGLTALLTPYLLVVVSTTPIAQTQFKSPRSKEVEPHSALTGCLAWFPAVKLRSAESSATNSKTKLAYCWSNVLNILEVESEDEGSVVDLGKPPTLHFKIRSRWKYEEAILTVQWISRSVLALLTISQRLVILEDPSLRLADTSDLIPKHIYHQDLFSRQLQPLVEKAGEDVSMHGVVPDAFHMSFKAYKGRLFLLGMNEVFHGIMSNWADRLVSLMHTGNFIAAIELATAYYNGEGDRVTVGLSDDDTLRHATVKPKLLEMILSSQEYISNQEHMIDTEEDLKTHYQALARVSFKACLDMDEIDYLFEELYDWYCDASVQDIFLTTMEPYIIEGSIKRVPTPILKDMIIWYGSLGMTTRLEEMICSLDTSTMDIDQVTATCKQFHLYDALIYIWNQALGDYIMPIIDLISLSADSDRLQHDAGSNASEFDDPAMKIFPYMAYALTGRVYPQGSEMPLDEAVKAKDSLYNFLFSDRTINWPESRGEPVYLSSEQPHGLSYPYVRFFLSFDASDFTSMLNEAFEDSYLDGGQEQLVNGTAHENHSQNRTSPIKRQRIVDILLEVSGETDFDFNDKIFVDIFIARNVPKFAFASRTPSIRLKDSTLRTVLTELCNYPREELAGECQLSVEYLLSTYRPIDLESFVPLFRKARFYKILKTTYRRGKQFANWLSVFFEDPDDTLAIFDCIHDCFRPSTGLNKRQMGEVKEVILEHATDLVEIDASRAASCLQEHDVELLGEVIDRLDVGSHAQFLMLQTVLEPKNAERSPPDDLTSKYTELYVKLMCKYNPQHVSDFVSVSSSGNLQLENLLPAMEESGVVDAAVVLMARDGLVLDAMTRLKKHLANIETAIVGLLNGAGESPDHSAIGETARGLMESLQKYVKIGTWLCHGQTENATDQARPSSRRGKRPTDVTEGDLKQDELLWVDLIDAVVGISQAVNDAVQDASVAGLEDGFSTDEISSLLRGIVQDTFTKLLASTSGIISSGRARGAHSKVPSSPTLARDSTRLDYRFLRILYIFLTRAAHHAPSLADLRKVLADIFSAYAFEESMLSLANEFIDKDVFVHVADANKKRRAGWRPRAQICEWCRRRAWGAGAGAGIWEAWRKKKAAEMAQRMERFSLVVSNETSQAGGDEKGKNKAPAGTESTGTESVDADEDAAKPDKLVIFTCSHLFHQQCLEKAMAQRGMGSGTVMEGEGRKDYQCTICA